MGTLADMFNVEPRWERAVEGVFGSSLQAIIVPTPDDAARAAHVAQGERRGSRQLPRRRASRRERRGGHPRDLQNRGRRGGAATTGTGCEVSGDVRIRDLLGAPRELLAVLNRTLPQRMNARVDRSLDACDDGQPRDG